MKSLLTAILLLPLWTGMAQTPPTTPSAPAEKPADKANPLANLDPAKSVTYIRALRDALAKFEIRDYKGALERVDEVERIGPPTPATLNLRGAIAIEEKRFEDGLKYCQQAINISPDFYPARFNIAEIPFVQKKYDEARKEFQKLHDSLPKREGRALLRSAADSELIQFRIYLTYLLAGNDAKAKEFLDALPDLNDSPILHHSQAAWEFVHNNPEGGMKWIRQSYGLYRDEILRNFLGFFWDQNWVPRPGAQEPAAPERVELTPGAETPTIPAPKLDE